MTNPLTAATVPGALRVLISRADDSSWQAQALECDVLAISPTRAAALDTLIKVIGVHVTHDARHGRKPLSGFAPAPEHCWMAFHRTTRVAQPVEFSHEGHASGLHFLVANFIDGAPNPS